MPRTIFTVKTSMRRLMRNEKRKVKSAEVLTSGGFVRAVAAAMGRRVTVLRVEVHQLDSGDHEPGLAEHPGLDRDIGDVLVFDRAGRLDLDQDPALAVPAPEQHVHGNEPAPGLEARLEDGGRAGCERRFGRGYPVGVGMVGVIDEGTARELLPGQFAHVLALVEEVLEDLVRS